VSRKSLIAVSATVLAALSGQGAWAAGDDSPVSAPANLSAGTSSDTSETLQEVTVTARRVELEKRVAKFVNRIAATENGAEGLARWQKPSVCPLVSGLPQQDGEFILERISEIARGAGVPLADEHCRPNLYILVTDKPEDLLRGMEKRNRAYTFGYDNSFYPPTETPAGVVDAFIKTPRAVRVWYGSSEKDASGKPLSYCQSQAISPQCKPEEHTAACDPAVRYRCGTGIVGGSYLVSSTVWTFSRVFVIVDQTRLRGVTVGQLADFVAMSGFAKLKPDARLDDVPTILELFDGAPQAAPIGMTNWDQTFLKSLYATDQISKQQRSQIARQMVREMTP
jgi:hypothetical protein